MDLKKIQELLSRILPKDVENDKPHKSIAILAVIDGICSGIFSENKIYFDSDFKKLFSKYFVKYSRAQDRDRPLAPFFHLRSSGFWHLMPIRGQEETLARVATVGSPRDLFKIVDHAYIDDKLFILLKNDKKICNTAKEIILNSLAPYITNASSSLALKIPSKFPHEQQALEAIIPPLEKQVQFISNFELHDPGTNEYLECDLIAVCSNCIVIIELKHWGGQIDIAPNNWQVNSKYRPDPHKANNFKCKVLKSSLEKAFPYLHIPWVDSAVVLTNPDARIYNYSLPKKAQKNPSFAGTDALVRYLQFRMSTEKQVLNKNDQKKIADFLWKQAEGPKKKGLEIPGYELLENITQSPNRLDFLARVKGFELQTVKRLRIFLSDPTLPDEERKKQRVRAQNTLKALDQVGNHPNLLRVEPVANDNNLVIEVSDWSDEGTLADVLRRKGHFTVKESVKIIQGIIAGLKALHDQMVVHRDLRPDNILLGGLIPVLMNFDYTYLPDDHKPEYTVFPDPESLDVSPFLAPELYIDGQFSEATDLFSVGVIFYTLLCGEPPFSSSLDLLQSGDELSEKYIPCLKDTGANDSIINLIKSLIMLDRTERPQEASDVEKIINELLMEPEQQEELQAKHNDLLEPGASHDVYEIDKMIGKGREAQVYIARKIGGQQVALKLFFHEIPRNRIVDEQRHIALVKSPFILHAHGIHTWQDGRFFLETNYINGPSLRSLINEKQLPDVETFRRVTSCLLQAVKAMHRDPSREKALLHNDIKPDNILLSESNDPVLIDFGTSCFPHIGLYSGTDHYVAPDLLRKIDFEFCENGDLFALGVTLFEWLCGCSPYDGIPSLESTPKSVSDLRKDEIPLSLIQWLDQAIQPQRGNRFEDILIMQEAFDAIWEPVIEDQEDMTSQEPEHHYMPREHSEEETQVIEQNNSYVRYLNTLHNATAVDDGALAETQALSEHFGQIHVPLPQTEYIFQRLTSQEGSNVILTGHAGDGKSTIGLELYKKIKNIPHDAPLQQSLQDHEKLNFKGYTIHIIKDMSELSSAEKNEKITASLQSNKSERWCFISNTGTLLSTFKTIARQRKEHWYTLESELLNSLVQADPQSMFLFEEPFAVINLAQTDNIQIGITVLERILKHGGWELCGQCDVQQSCPIYQNVSSLIATQDISFDRISWIYRRLKAYGVRLTMRQLTGHLAYSLTGGINCIMVHNQAVSPMPSEQMDNFFSNRFFGYTNTGVDEQASRMKAIQHIRELEMGSKPFPALDRILWSQESEQLPTLPDNILRMIAPLQKKAHEKKMDSTDLEVRQFRQAIRRLYYIFGDFPPPLTGFIPQFLASQMLVETEKWQKATGPESMQQKQLLSKILHVLQEEYTGFQLSDNHQSSSLYITLRRRDDGYRQSVQFLLAQIPLTSFNLHWRQLNQQFEPKRHILVLQEKMSKYELLLGLPFLDFVLMRDMGEVGQRLHAGYRDRLKRFKTQLLEYPGYKTEQMVLLEMERDGKFKTRSLDIHDNQLQVTS